MSSVPRLPARTFLSQERRYYGKDKVLTGLAAIPIMKSEVQTNKNLKIINNYENENT
jgi:hypothetical protein